MRSGAVTIWWSFLSGAYLGTGKAFGGNSAHNLSKELEVVPSSLGPARVSQESGGMIRHHHRHSLVTIHLSSQPPQGYGLSREELARKGAHSQNRLRREELDLTLEKGSAFLDFPRKRVPVPRGTTLQDVANVSRGFPGEIDSGQ
jgi:hypothetical protein